MTSNPSVSYAASSPIKGALKPLLIGEVAHRAGEVAFCRPWDGTYDAACECELRPANCVL